MQEEKYFAGINKNTYDLLFGDKYNIPKEEWGKIENMIAFATIDYFTKLKERNIFEKLLNKYLKNKKYPIDRITYNENTKQFEYNFENQKITFDKLSNHIFNDEIKNELTSKKRYKECHHKSINLTTNIKNSRIVTGYITLGKNKYLHSVVEYNKENEIIVLDWTRNLYIEKKQYEKLLNFEELTSIEADKVIEDIDYILDKLDISVKAYLLFREEITNDLEKQQKRKIYSQKNNN